ncbi:MAG: TetR/AcrR family transcriptional regulator [Ignavibacteriales bacterium]
MEIDKRQKVLNVARELFDRYGFKKTTVDEIAADAGISKRTLYEMFDSKETIMSEIVAAEGDYLRSLLQKEFDKVSDPIAKIQNLTRKAADHINDNPFLSQLLSDTSGLFRPFAENEIIAIEKSIEAFYQNTILEGIHKGVFRKMDEDTAANCIFVLFRNFTYGSDPTPIKTWIDFAINAISDNQSQSDKPAKQNLQLELFG